MELIDSSCILFFPKFKVHKRKDILDEIASHNFIIFLSPKKFPKTFKFSKAHFGSLINSINSSILLIPILF